MRIAPLLAFQILSISMAGRAIALEPVSYEEALNKRGAQQPFRGGPAQELRYRVGFQYANRARLEDDSSWQIRNPDTLNTPIYDALTIQVAATNFALGDSALGSLDLLTWFNSGLSKEARYSHYLNYTFPYVSIPNTQYYRFDEQPGTATAADVFHAWDQAFALMATLHPASECYVFGWTKELQYRRTYMKNLPGSHKEILFLCPHPVFTEEQIKVTVSAYANPAPGLRTVSMVESQCWVDRPRSRWLDVTPCGIEMANRQWSRIPDEADASWMQLVVTPTADDPGKMVTVARYRDRELVMESPGVKPEYAEFLRESQRGVKDGD